jgi:hypothetical protein
LAPVREITERKRFEQQLQETKGSVFRFIVPRDRIEQ